jgi:nitrogen fixation/metabolism regulation signal transduction histidine kinase
MRRKIVFGFQLKLILSLVLLSVTPIVALFYLSQNLVKQSFTLAYDKELDETLLASFKALEETQPRLSEKLETELLQYRQLKFWKQPFQKSLNLTFCLLLLVVLILTVSIGSFLVRRLLQPIRSLVQGMERVSKGEFDCQIKVKAKDELKLLVDAFNQMMVDLRESRQKLIEAERKATWQQIARRLAHEIKNPLTPIQLSIYQLRKRYSEKLGEKEAFHQYTEVILEEVEHLKKLVAEFSTFAREPKLKRVKCSLKELLEKVLILYKESFNAARIKVNFQADKDLPPAVVDQEQLKRVFQNIIKNALQAMLERGGELKIEMRKSSEDNFLTLAFADNGCGIKKRDLSRIFTPYFSTKKEGTGLGLFISKQIIEAHGGKIKIETEEGKGTQVMLELPCLQEEVV